jgi:hypothetical protein
MTTNIQFQGKIESKEWPCYQWLVTINGINFEYRTGLGHSSPKFKGEYNRTSNRKPNRPCITLDAVWVHIPEIDEILHCLFSDAQYGSESFDDFCDNLGYSNDSLKALDSYRACMECSKKLRQALTHEYSSVQKRIEALEI